MLRCPTVGAREGHHKAWSKLYRKRFRLTGITVQASQHPSGLIVKIAGDAGVENVPVLERELTRLSAAHPKLVVFDLSELDFIASLGMGALMAFRKGVVRAGGAVRIAAAKPAVLDSFKRAALKELFNTCTTVDEALSPKTS
jgi:anti-anti-sigma factor